MPAAAKKILNKAAYWLETYPEQDSTRLQSAIAKSLGLPFEWVLCGSGSMELIYLLPRLFNRPKIFDFQPTFSGYENAFKADQGYLKSARFDQSENNWTLPKKLSIPINTDIFFLCNPNNPTGHYTRFEDLHRVAGFCEKNQILFIIDEAYIDFCGPAKKVSFVSEIKKYKYTGVLRTFTKSFSLPGIRLGYLAGHPAWLDKIRSYQAPWSVNPLAQVLGEKLLKEESYLNIARKYIEEIQKEDLPILKKVKQIRFFETRSNFILCQIINCRKSVAQLIRFLANKKMIIRDCSNFKTLEKGNYFRFAFRKHTENIKLYKAMRDFFNA